MSIISKISLIFILLWIILFLPRETYPLSKGPGGYPNIDEAFKSADSILRGKVMSIEWYLCKTCCPSVEEGCNRTDTNIELIEFRVDKVLKGNNIEKKIYIKYGWNSIWSSLQLEILPNREYILFIKALPIKDSFYKWLITEYAIKRIYIIANESSFPNIDWESNKNLKGFFEYATQLEMRAEELYGVIEIKPYSKEDGEEAKAESEPLEEEKDKKSIDELASPKEFKSQQEIVSPKDIQPCPKNKVETEGDSSNNWLHILAIALSIIIGALIIILLTRKIKRNES